MGQPIWKPLLLMLVMVLLFDLFYNMISSQTTEQTSEITYSRFREELAADNIKNITIKGTFIRGEFRNKTKITQVEQAKETVREVSGFTTVLPAIPDPDLMADLTAKKVEVKAVSTESSPLMTGLIY